MTFYTKSEDWLHQSSLLLEARPETTRVVTRYRLRPAQRRTAAEKKAEAEAEGPAETTTTTTKPPRGHLEIKTYDPVSGVTLKYKTSKAAEVSRLVQMLGGLGRRMAALPAPNTSARADEPMPDADPEAAASGVQTPVPGAASGSGHAQGQQGGKGKKKKGKR